MLTKVEIYLWQVCFSRTVKLDEIPKLHFPRTLQMSDSTDGMHFVCFLFPFLIFLLLSWGYIVAFTQILTICQIYHS
jgi:hypothetical protein